MSELHVIFGTGTLGRWTAEALLSMGKTVRMINRSGNMEKPPKGVELIASDAYDTNKNRAVTAGAVAVYQCAQPAYSEWPEKFPPLQTAILQAASANDTKLIVGDNLYMYGSFTGSLREDSPIRPHTKKGFVRAAMAEEIQHAHQAGRVRAAVGRASNFFGPYDTTMTDYAFMPAVLGKTANLLGNSNMPHTFTYIQDFGRLMAALGTHEQALGETWFAPSNPAITQTEMIQIMETELGKPVKSMVAVPMLMRLLGLFDKTIAETVEMMYEWTAPFVIDTQKAQAAFGLAPTPMREAIRETIAWCREQSVRA